MFLAGAAIDANTQQYSRNRNAIVGGSAAADLIEKDQAGRGDIINDAGRFVHFYHESRFTAGQVIRRAYTGKNLIGQWDPCFSGWHKTSDMSHEADEGSLPEQGTLTAHVQAGENDYLLVGLIKFKIVADE